MNILFRKIMKIAYEKNHFKMEEAIVAACTAEK